MTFTITASGAAQEAIDRIVPQLVADGVAGRLVQGRGHCDAPAS